MAGAHNHDHHHHEHANNRRRLVIVLSLTVTYMVAEFIGGFLTNSLALLSDAGHMLADVAALALAMLALWFASRPITAKKTYGYYRLEILAALANGVALVLISLLIFYEAIQRIKQPEMIEYGGMMIVAGGGLIVNIASAVVLYSASEENLNIRGAFLHVIGDALGSVGALVAGFIVWQWGWTIADPILSIAMCLLIIYSSWQLIRESVNVLLEGTPSHINIRAVVGAMHTVSGVADVHDLHVWAITSGKEALSAHVTLQPGASHRATLEALQDKLKADFNIGHVTLQLESPDEAESATGRLYQIVPRSQESGFRGQEPK